MVTEKAATAAEEGKADDVGSKVTAGAATEAAEVALKDEADVHGEEAGAVPESRTPTSPKCDERREGRTITPWGDY